MSNPFPGLVCSLTLIAALPGASLAQSSGRIGAQPVLRASGSVQAAAQTAHAPSGLVARYFKLPLRFEANRGQADKQVRFISRGLGYDLFLTAREAVLVLSTPAANRRAPGERLRPEVTATPTPPAVVRLELTGANRHPAITEEDPLPTKTNYFIGNCPTEWRTGIPNYAEVRYQDVYPGIDLIYYGNQRRLEHDFVVAPGADPGRITFGLGGVSKLRIDGGDLVMSTPYGELRMLAPEIYQSRKGSRYGVPGRYVLKGGNRVGFEVAKFDRRQPLVIDPVLIYSTYLGGNVYDEGLGISVDPNGNAYITGTTKSTNFPTASAFQGSLAGTENVFVTKLLADGSSLVYSTYLGGSGSDDGYSIAVDSNGNAYVAGETNSTNFPTVNAFQSSYGGGSYDAFVTKLAADGSSLVYSTYLGGNENDGGYGIAVDSSDNVYVTGHTNSTNFPTVNGFQSSLVGTTSAFITKLAADGSGLVYSTYLGGSKNDGGYGIAVDSSGNAYVTGETTSTNFPTASAFQGSLVGTENVFVTKLAPGGSSLVYSTYLGGSSTDLPMGIAIDSSDNAYVTGGTSSANFPTQSAFQASLAGTYNAFITKLAANGSSLAYSTYLGGGGADEGTGIAVDSSGDAYVTGGTSSANFPTQNAIQGTLAGTVNAFVAELAANGSSLVYSSYLGGSVEDDAAGIAVDSSGDAFVTGEATSTNFPTTQSAFQSALAGPRNAFVAKIGAASNLTGQTITVTTAAPASAADNSTFMVAAMASSGLPVSIAGGGACTGSGTGSATITMSAATGTCTVTYAQAGNSTYAAAPTVTSSTQVPNPVPAITVLTPSSATAGSAGFTLTVTGSSFISSSVVNFNGSAEATTYVSATQLTATIPAAAIASAGTPGVTVTNPAPSGGTSNSLSFTINAPAAPTFTVSSSTAPQTVQPGAAAQYTITVMAQNGNFSGTVGLAATGLPTGAMATFSPASVSPGSTSTTSQLTIQTPATTAAVERHGSSWLLAAALLPLVGLCFTQTRRWRLLTLCLLFASLGAVSTLSGCGSGSGSGQHSPQTYTITVTGTSGSAQQTTTVQLTVE